MSNENTLQELTERLNALELKVKMLSVNKVVLEQTMSDIIYSLMVSGKLSTQWLSYRISETEKDLDNLFQRSMLSDLYPTYQKYKQSNFLHQLIDDINNANDLIQELDLEKHLC